MNNGSNHNNFSSADIEKYRQGQLTPSRMHALEKAALEDPFLADAMEGFEAGRPASQVSEDISELKERLRRRVEEKKDKAVLFAGWWKIAALLIVIAGTAWVYRLMIAKNTAAPEMAKAKVQPTEENKRFYYNSTADSSRVPPPVTAAKTPKTTSAQSFINQSAIPEAERPKASEVQALMARDSTFAAVAENRATGPAITPARKPYDRIQTDTVTFNANYNNSRQSLFKKAKDAGKDTAHLSLQLTNVKPRPIDTDYQLEDEKHEDLAKFGADKAPYKANAFAPTSMGAAARSMNTFNGQVVDNYLKPVQGASITIRGRNNSVSTDSFGNFSIRTPDSALKVSVASVGFRQRDVLLRNNVGSFGPSTNAGNQIILQQNTNALSDVAVIGYGSRKKNNKSVEDLMKKLPSVDVLTFDAEPTAGWTEYNNYLVKNKKVPAAAANIHGMVVVRFDVHRKGTLKNVQVEKSLNKALDDEALRLVKNGPSWRLLKGKKAKASVTVQF